MNKSPVLCTAPFTALMITPERKVRPCCKFLGDLGDLNKQTITEVLDSTTVKNLQKDMYANRWPAGCRDCKTTEQAFNNSVRITFLPGGGAYYNNWNKGITSLEISSSNVCNLSCAGCNTRFSSSWNKYFPLIEKNKSTKFYRDVINEYPIIKADNELLIKNLSELDLTRLRKVNFKGGEPLLNTDMLAALRYFDKIDILHKIEVVMDTSGAIIIDKTINETITLLSETRIARLNISIDGPNEVQTYIRYSAKNMASLDNMRNFINVFEKNNINFTVCPTIMVYNIFSLDRLVEWWLYEIKPAFNHLDLDIYLFNFLIGPNYLSLQALQPATISKLIDYYNNIIKTKEYGDWFSHFPDVLKNIEYGGDKLHNQMIKYTLDMDKIKGQSVYEAIPELTNELRYL